MFNLQRYNTEKSSKSSHLKSWSQSILFGLKMTQAIIQIVAKKTKQKTNTLSDRVAELLFCNINKYMSRENKEVRFSTRQS